jgi:hypothetical protein
MKINVLPCQPWVPVFFQLDLKDTEISIRDGTTPTANSITIRIGEGNLTYTERVTREYLLDAGRLDEVRNGDEVPVELAFDAVWDYITGTTGTGGVPSIEDALKQEGAAATWISSDADVCRPYAVDVVLNHTPNCSAQDAEETVFSDFRYEQIDHDLRAGTFAISGQCNVTEAVSTRTPQST